MKHFFSETLKIIHKTGVRFKEDRCSVEARALSFITLLALIPSLVLILFQLSRLPFYSSLKDQMLSWVNNYFLPAQAGALVEYFQQVPHDLSSAGVLGILFSLLMLFVLILALSRSVNYIWRKKVHRRHLVLILLKFLFITVFIPTFIVITFLLQNYQFISRIMDMLLAQTPLEFFSRINLNYLLSLVINWLILTLLLMLIPNERVKLPYALVAGVVTGTLWFVLRYGLNVYIKLIPQISLLYGSLGFIPIFMIWINLSWIILLFGFELNYVFHYQQQPFRVRSPGTASE
jgi:membrane protein